MATISTFVSGEINFTAPFDCIIGIEVRSDDTFTITKRYANGSGAYELAASVTKILVSCVVMKAGDRIVTTRHWTNSAAITAHITGVSA